MPDVTIDKVQIEVEATASKANIVLKQLETNLGKVKSALAGFDTSSLTKMQNALDAIEKKVNNVSNSKVTPKIDTSGITKSEKQISNSVDNLQDKFTRLAALANAALGGDKSAITSFQRQAVSMQAEIDVVQNKLRRLGDTRIASDTFARLIQQSNLLDSQLTDMKHQMDAIMSGKKVVSDNQFKNLSENIVKTRTELDSVNDKMREMEKAGTAYTDPFQKYRDGVATTQKSLDGLRDKIDSIKEKKPSVDTSKLIGNIQQAIKWTDNLIRKLLSVGGAAISKAVHGLGNAFNKIKDGASKTHSVLGKLNGLFDKGFMKLLKYGFGIRSVYVGFRRLRKAVVESFGELQKSGAFFQTTKANIEGLKTSLATLKFQFGAAFEPIFNAVAPALQSFINYLIQAMNVLSAFIAKVTGKETYSKVAAVTLAAAKNTAGAAKAAKELNKQLQGFDELNNLTTNNNAGGGGGSGGGASGDSAIYEEASVESALGDFGKQLAAAIAAGDWELVGSTIGDKLTEELKKLNARWPEIFAAASDFGTNLALFFNGLISDELFSELGTAVGNAINTALIAGLAFADTFDWTGLGTAIASGIDAFVQTNPLALVVDNFNAWALGILNTLITAIDTMIENGTLNTISKHIEEALANLKIGEIAWNVGKLGSSLANSIYIIVSNKKTWVNLGQKIADGINGFFTGMSEINEETGMSGWAALGKDIEATLVGIGTSIITALDGVDWQAVGKAIAEFIGNIDFKNILITFKNIMVAIGKAIKGALDGAEISVADVVLTLTGIALIIGTIASLNFAASITKVFLAKLIEEQITKLLASGAGLEIFKAGAGLVLKIAGVTIAMAAAATIGWQFGKTLGEFIATWLANKGIISKDAADEYSAINEMSITQKIGDIKLAYDTKDENGVSDLKKGWDLMWDETLAPVFDEAKDIILKIGAIQLTVINGVKTVAGAWTDFWTEWLTPVFDEAKSIGIKIKDVAFSMASGAKSIADSWTDFWGDVGEDAYDTVQASVELVKYGWDTVSEWVMGFIGSAVDLVVNLTSSESFNNIKATIDSWRSSAVDMVVNAREKVKGTLEKIKGIWDKFKKGDKKITLTTAIKDNVTRVIDKIKNAVKGLNQKGLNLKANISDTISSKIAKIKSMWDTLRTNARLTLQAVFQNGFTGPLKAAWNGIANTINSAIGVINKIPKVNITSRLPILAKGGYADKATNVIFGEAGAEAVIPLERNLGAINKIADAMLDGMDRVSKYRYTASPSQLAYNSGTVSSAYNSSMSYGDSEMIAEQNRLLAEQNRLLQQILQKPTGITSKQVFDAARQEAQNYNNRTGNSPFLF